MSTLREARVQTVYAVTSYDLGGNAGTVIEGIFSSEQKAERWIENACAVRKDEPYARENEGNPFEIEAVALDSDPVQSTYWHRGARVLPDGRVSDWKIEHPSYHEPMAPVDDQMAPWDGHSQGHCGWHISIFGSDEVEIETAFQRQVESVLPLCDGTCRFCGRTTDYKLDFWDGKSFGRVDGGSRA